MPTHIDGFEEFYGEQSAKLRTAMTRADYAAEGDWSVVSGRASNSRAMSGGKCSMTRTEPWVNSKFCTGVAGRFMSRGSMMWLSAGEAMVRLWLHPDTGAPMLNDSPGGAIPTMGRWYYYELEADIATTTLSLYINNRFDSSIPLPEGFLATETITVGLGWLPPEDYWPVEDPPADPPNATPVDNGVKTFDDFYMTSGARLGPIMVTTRFPSADVNVEWFKASTSGTHAQSLAKQPPDPLDSYVASDTVGKIERFSSTADFPSDNLVIITGILVMARKAPSLEAQLGVFMDGTAAHRSAVRTVENEWRTQYICFPPQNENKDNIVTSEFGITVAEL